ncbi:capsular polysaccharide biosynthesis protein [Bordetella genomosp. 4]|uniref:capsular polysaccharide biosynthesis protein n=1 Tax=Bordetella genomosp. 4 TaxID=463044 RepID=UPI000B9E07F8|nr:capsular polysaccharide biosynthesis protein [Bordetella genomosp. 4]OZI48379.1 beta-3-deoxy-D-manno-oct-2-ulosonic acid transferase [Bordetella genomosp. 4]
MTQPRLIICSAGVRRNATLAALLDDFALVYPKPSQPQPGDSVLAWGQRPSAQRAQRYAERHGLRVWHIEDGFLRSVGLGFVDPPLSVVMDDQGLYLDAGSPTRLETLIKRPLDTAQQQRAQALIAAWRQGRVSKYNHTRDAHAPLPTGYVLVVDQTYGDASVTAGGANPEDFPRMLEAALAEHPERTIVLKVHPDVVSGRKRGYFDVQQVRAMPRVVLMDQDVHPAGLLADAHAVYTVTSQLGFEALLWGKPVRVFGMPFYAGWGLTHDEQLAPERRRQAVSLAQLTHAALIDYCRYVDPETGRRCEVETVLAWIALQRRMRQRFPEHITAVGFSGWKHGFVRDFFGGSRMHFTWFAKRASQHDSVASWGRKLDAALASRPPEKPVIRVEDGFLRSVGLGADLIRPVSWVQDDVGIYYDATRVSRLEQILAQTDFSAPLLARAAALRETICASGITKYNLEGEAAWLRPPQAQRVLLVVGQVETDASIRYGASSIRRNMDLLRAVRQGYPHDYVLYKPHPDVTAGLRSSGQGESGALEWCDEVIGNVSLERLFPLVDEVHVLTSLAGFEALLRHKTVVTYGQPFYAGWGLTEDRALIDDVRRRRERSLTLDELVAGTLILYPTYVSRITRRFATPERVLQELIDWRQMPKQTNRWRHWIAKVFREK